MASAQVATVIGVRPLGDSFFSRLKQPGDTLKTSETLLVRRAGETVEYISPLRDGTPAFKKNLALDTPDLAAVYALAKPGGFAIRHDYDGHEVLVISRAFDEVPWVLVLRWTGTKRLPEPKSG